MKRITKQKAVLKLLILDFIRVEKELQEIGYKIVKLQEAVKKQMNEF